MRRHNAVRGVGAEHIKIAVPEPALALVEHIEGFCFVLLNRDNCPIEHGLGFICSAEFGCLDRDGSKEDYHRGITDAARLRNITASIEPAKGCVASGNLSDEAVPQDLGCRA
jgi:hypothetical protein